MSSILRSFFQDDLPENYFRVSAFVLRWTGIELVHEETFWYSIYSKLVLFIIVYSYTCVEAYELYIAWGDLDKVTQVLNYLVTHAVGAIKITDMYLQRKRFKSMMKKLHEGVFKPDKNRGGLDEERSVRSIVKKIEIQNFIFYLMIGLVAIGALADSLRTRLTQPRENWRLPFLDISLIDTSKFPMYELAYIYQMVCVVSVGCLIATTDLLRTSIMALISVQLHLLQHAFRNIQRRAIHLQNTLEENKKSLDACIRQVVKDSIDHHLVILKFGEETENRCCNVVFVIMLFSVMQLCFLLYAISLVPIQSPLFIQYFAYWSGVAFQTAQYCYWGNEVTLQSKEVAKGVFESNWPDAPPAVSRALIPVMVRAQKPFYFTAGKFVPLSLQVFMSDDLPENYFRVSTFVLRWTGIELLYEETFWYSIYSKIILIIIVYFYTCVEAYELYISWGDLNEVTKVLNYLFIHIVGAMKVTNMYLYRKRFKLLMKKLHEGVFKPDVNRGGVEEIMTIRRIIRIIEAQNYIFYLMIGLVATGALIDSLRTRLTQPRDEWSLPFLDISLIDTSKFPIYELAFVYQNLGMILAGFLIGTGDVLRTSIMAFIGGQFQILQNAFRNIKQRAIHLQSTPEGNGRSLEDCFNQVIQDSIEHHLAIFEVAEEMENLCSGDVFVIVLFSVIHLCFLLYAISLAPIRSVLFIQYFFFWFGVAFETGQFCYWGNEVTSQASEVVKGVSDSDWLDAPSAVSKALVLVMVRAQKPFYFTAGKFVRLSLQIFMSIVKGSFSYFMVLRQMNEAKSMNN